MGQNGEKEKSEKSGRSGALPWIGRGFYRRTLSVPKRATHAYLQFDGAMSEPHVYVNGKLAGWWAYGYNAFRIDITPYMMKGRSNEVVVSLNNREESSRWYPGGGLYRPVSLILTGKAFLDPWQCFLYTEKADASTATMSRVDRASNSVSGYSSTHPTEKWRQQPMARWATTERSVCASG